MNSPFFWASLAVLVLLAARTRAQGTDPRAPSETTDDATFVSDARGETPTRISVVGAGATSVQRVANDALRAYIFGNPGIAAKYEPITSLKGKLALMENSVDFAVSDSVPSQQDLADSSDLVALPLVAQALVAAMNIEGVEITNKIVLSPRVLVDMVMGNITYWDDPRIQSLNPTVHLPHASFSVVIRTDSIGQNLIVSTAFAKWSPAWQATYGVSSTWNWPDRANLVKTPGAAQFLDAFDNLNNALGLMWLDDAVDNGYLYSYLINSAGTHVEPSARTVRFSIMDKGVEAVNYDGGIIDITDAKSVNAWPLAGYSYVLLHRFDFRETCAIKTETVKFLTWFYQSVAAEQICSRRQFVRLPDFVRDEHHILSVLNSEVFCADGLSLAASAQLVSHGIGSSLASALFDTHLSVYQEMFPGQLSSIDYELADPDAALQRLKFAEVDFVALTPRIMRQKVLTEVERIVYTLPLFTQAVVPIHGLERVNSSDPALVMDMPTLALIWTGKIKTWDHPSITALNPVLTAKGALTGNITKVMVKIGQRQATKFFIQALAESVPDEFPYSILGQDVKAYTFDSLPFFAKLPNKLMITVDTQMESAVMSTPGAIGFVMDDGQIQALTISILRNSVTLTPHVLSQQACLSDSFNETTLRYNGLGSKNAECWPFTCILYSTVLRENRGDSCVSRLRGLKFLRWTHNAPDDSTVGNVAASMGLYWVPYATRQLVKAALESVTCEGETMLVTLPLVTRLSVGVVMTSSALGGVGITLCALAVAFIWIFHRRTAVRSSSPIFLFVTVCGIAMLFLSGIFFSEANPTDSSCGSAFWLLSLGFYLTFAPLFAKSWRIYKIFMRTQMSVLKITDMTLFSRLLVVLVSELILLSVIAAVDPVIARTEIQTALPRDLLVSYCAPSTPALVAVLGACKAVLLVFGTIMSFTTRGVSDNFNESKPIAFSIYNTTFTTIIVMLIALLQSGVLSIIQLIIFAVHWIALCTFVINFLPKVLTVWKNAVGFVPDVITNSRLGQTGSGVGAGNNNSGQGSAGRGSGGGAMRSLKDFINTTIRMLDRTGLKTYITLMKKELTAAEAALATLNANEGALQGVHYPHHTTAALPDNTTDGPGQTFSGGFSSNSGGNLAGGNIGMRLRSPSTDPAGAGASYRVSPVPARGTAMIQQQQSMTFTASSSLPGSPSAASGGPRTTALPGRVPMQPSAARASAAAFGASSPTAAKPAQLSAAAAASSVPMTALRSAAPASTTIPGQAAQAQAQAPVSFITGPFPSGPAATGSSSAASSTSSPQLLAGVGLGMTFPPAAAAAAAGKPAASSAGGAPRPSA